MVTMGSRTADIGCDHGFVSIYLYEHKIAPKVYAMDLREGPLERAREHIAARGFSDYIETRLSDGLEALRAGEADTLICAGMGGRLMAEILTRGQEKAKLMKELILQPQSELRYFRAFLRENGYAVVAENMVKEDGKFYVVMKAVYRGKEAPVPEGISDETWQRAADSFGACLLAERHPILKEYLEMLQDRNEKILAGLDNGKRRKREKTAAVSAAGEKAGENAKNAWDEATERYGEEAARGKQRKRELLEELSAIECCLSFYKREGEGV